ncbi:MAG: hypothetical protein QM803_04325 [Rhodocyclaceae bacterium]
MTAVAGKMESSKEGFYFVSTPITGDFTLVARMTSANGLVYSSSQQFRVGLMAYDTSSTAANVFANVSIGTDAATAVNWVPVYGTRTAVGAAVGKSTSTANQVTVGSPIYMKLVRSGDQYTMWVAADTLPATPLVYKQLGSAITLASVSTMSVGFMMAPGGSGTASTTVVYDNISLTQP